MPPRCAHAAHGLAHRRLAFRVEIGIGLVEHDQERPAEEGAGQSDPLALPRGKLDATLPDHRVVAVRKADHGLVEAGERRGLDDQLRVASGLNRAMFSAIVPSNSCTSCGR